MPLSACNQLFPGDSFNRASKIKGRYCRLYNGDRGPVCSLCDKLRKQITGQICLTLMLRVLIR